MFARRTELEARQRLPKGKVEDLPLPVVPDWGRQVRRANSICRLIDRHLRDECRRRPLLGKDGLSPRRVCSAGRVRMIADLCAAIRGNQQRRSR